ncbi:MAG TPA: class I SAM-dependent methyltransferase [Ignavibacteriaceae bacterium]|nr:class I SAM-dependent methyltransferase [Ignavibacteriaceae bacterium]
MNKEWYKEWFNSDEYLKVYKHRNSEEAIKLVNLILYNIEITEGASILDLACGAGRHAAVFAERLFDVTGIDLSGNLLRIAKDYSFKRNLNTKFIRSDLKYFQLKKKFDVIVNLFTSFGYFETDEENYALFKRIYNHLEKPGYFVLDYLNKNYVKDNLVPSSIDENGDIKIEQKRTILNNRIIKDIKVNKLDKAFNFQESVRLFSSEEILFNLRLNGFNIENVFGDFEGNEFKESSPRLIIIAKK